MAYNFGIAYDDGGLNYINKFRNEIKDFSATRHIFDAVLAANDANDANAKFAGEAGRAA